MECGLEGHIGADGRLILEPEETSLLGLSAGGTVLVEGGSEGLRLRPAAPGLSKVYVEPTSACNLACRTCIRNAWDEPEGHMEDETFARLCQALRSVDPPLMVSFGGFGESLSHPRILEMVSQVKALKASVELVTNGTLLSEGLSRGLIAAGLDTLWVSLDGATPESYSDVRLGAELRQVLDNLARFRDLRKPGHGPRPIIGVVFVAMKRNIDDLPELLLISKRLGATRFLVTNLLPYTPDLKDEILYSRALSNNDFMPSSQLPSLILPKMDTQFHTRRALYQAICGEWGMTFQGSETRMSNTCPFIRDGALTVGWDGSVSPCIPLLRSSRSYLNGLVRFERPWILGNVNERSLIHWWREPQHQAFRNKVREFTFPPCTICDGCGLSETNETDCYGNGFPTCGGCLWSQGIILCP